MLETLDRHAASGRRAAGSGGGGGGNVGATNLWDKPAEAVGSTRALGRRRARRERRRRPSERLGRGCGAAGSRHTNGDCSEAGVRAATATATGLRRRLEGRQRASQGRPGPVGNIDSRVCGQPSVERRRRGHLGLGRSEIFSPGGALRRRPALGRGTRSQFEDTALPCPASRHSPTLCHPHLPP
ncbi:hypothetical protein BDU57DRAFT_264248 [Ampelomyces quisqualis]|uniref:Uncharacterized protein n=1 Tax=Ampelomyces quisqualis TaxID=50730 RepID=A0A6A5QJZ4_AMPQU|nr:hypothetical protein BDU57DRAFT_264248 [Ampelomyces quisqualis]